MKKRTQMFLALVPTGLLVIVGLFYFFGSDVFSFRSGLTEVSDPSVTFDIAETLEPHIEISESPEPVVSGEKKIKQSKYTGTRAEYLTEVSKTLASLFPLKGPSEPGDWLLSHAEEGQTFAEYLTERPVRPGKTRKYIYIQPIGEFNRIQKEILSKTMQFMSIYFGLEVKELDNIPIESIPEKYKRVHPEWGDHQILTGYILSKILRKNLPNDAVNCIGFTTSDLWPGDGWNFVYGEASLRARVGVWSIYRNGDPGLGKQSYKKCLLRTLKTATHEMGHMFSIDHCIKYECNMCGCNNRSEADRNPIHLCPECLAKVCWSCRIDPVSRYSKLSEFYRKNDFDADAAFVDTCLEKLRLADILGKRTKKK